MRAVKDSLPVPYGEGEESEWPRSTAAMGPARVPFHGNVAGKNMKREYGFSNAMRGKFYRKGAELRLPIYLDSAMRKRLEHIAKKRGKPVGDLVNQLLKKQLAVVETKPRLHGRSAA